MLDRHRAVLLLALLLAASARVGDAADIEYLGGPNDFFNIGSNWQGGQVPGASDNAFIRNGDQVGLVGIVPATIASLTIDNGSALAVTGGSLQVQGSIELVNFSQSEFSVSRFREVSAGSIDISPTTTLTVDGTLSTTGGSGIRDISNSGLLHGGGALSLSGLLSNDGIVEADNGTLTIDAVPGSMSASIDLDGFFETRRNELRAVTGSLDINVPLAPTSRPRPIRYVGLMTIGAGQFVELDEAIRVAFQGLGAVRLNGNASPSQAATLRLPAVSFESGGSLVADNTAVVDGDVQFFTTGSGGVFVPDVNDTLTITGDVLSHRFMGDGQVVINGELDADAGDTRLGELEVQKDALLRGGRIDVATLTAGSDFNQTDGTLAFQDFIGKLGQTGGVIEVDDSEIDGSLAQEGSPTLAFEVNGPTAFSRLAITGAARLAGMIDVTLGNGYDPAQGEQFPIVTAGEFDIDSLVLAGPDANRFDLTLDGDTLLLEVLPPPPSGDYTGDGIVDARNFTVWRDGASPAGGTQAEYLAWAANFGAGTNTQFAAAAVPEPSSIVLLPAVFAASCVRREA